MERKRIWILTSHLNSVILRGKQILIGPVRSGSQKFQSVLEIYGGHDKNFGWYRVISTTLHDIVYHQRLRFLSQVNGFNTLHVTVHQNILSFQLIILIASFS